MRVSTTAIIVALLLLTASVRVATQTPTTQLPFYHGVSPQAAHITNQRYQNTELLWSAPKGLRYGDLPGALDAQKANLYPDEAATYFVMNVSMPPKSTLVINGEYPHNRYLSYTVAKSLASTNNNAQIGNGDYLRGDEIVPDINSENPYCPGTHRNVTNRSYTIYVVQGRRPPNSHLRRTNTLYSNTTSMEERMHLSIRLYWPDEGFDGPGFARLTDNVTTFDSTMLMPHVTLLLANGTAKLTGPILLSVLRASKNGDPNGYSKDLWLKEVATSGDPINAPCFVGLPMSKFWNNNYSITGAFYARHPEQRVRDYSPSDDGGFANNPDTTYLIGMFSFALGDVVVVSGKMPTHPRTRHNPNGVTTEHPDVLYFSISTAAAPLDGRGWASATDEEIPLDSRGFYTIVISWPWNRPKTATLEHGVVWLTPGHGEGDFVGARDWVGAVYVRYQGTSKNWTNSPYYTPMPTIQEPISQDAIVMGEYFPVMEYTTASAFDRATTMATS